MESKMDGPKWGQLSKGPSTFRLRKVHFRTVHFRTVSPTYFKMPFRNSKWYGEVSSRIAYKNRTRNNHRNWLEWSMSNSNSATKSSSKETPQTKSFKKIRLEKNYGTPSPTISIFQIFDDFSFRIDSNDFQQSNLFPLHCSLTHLNKV